MTQENIELMESVLDAVNAEDTPGFVDFWHPECEFFSSTGSQMDAAPYRGHDGIRRYRQEAAEIWVTLRFETERILEGKDDAVVVALGHLRGEGRGSGISVDQQIGLVCELRDGQIRYCRSYRDVADALEAAGLSE